LLKQAELFVKLLSLCGRFTTAFGRCSRKNQKKQRGEISSKVIAVAAINLADQTGCFREGDVAASTAFHGMYVGNHADDLS